MSKKLRQEVIDDIKDNSILDLFDSVIYTKFNITSKELDYICENATDEELKEFTDALGKIDNKISFATMRKGIIVRNKLLQSFNIV